MTVRGNVRSRRRQLVLWVVAALVVFALVTLVVAFVATQLNAAAFARRPEIENWADPSRGTFMLGLGWGLVAAAVTVAVGVAADHLRLRSAR
jgi:threonine/homoserine/homoserine lactone efflux protein